VINALKETGLAAKELELEVSKGRIIHNENEAIETLFQLKKFGRHLGIDDFGTGYSFQSYLQIFNIDKLTIEPFFYPRYSTLSS
jgi:predicted signal transduction protein with EAL and GGDEF domain